MVSFAELSAHRGDIHSPCVLPRNFNSVLCCKTSQSGERNSGCIIYAASGSSSNCSRIFSTSSGGPAKTVGLLAFGGVRVKVDDGLVFCGPCRFSGSFSNDVSNRAGAFENFDRSLVYAAQTLGKTNTWIFGKYRCHAVSRGW